MNKKSQSDSIRQKLLNYSIKKNISFSSAETTFLIERLVARLMQDKDLASRLIFKGGFVGLKVHQSARYTVDLDAILNSGEISKILEKIKELVEVDLGDSVWFRFDSEVDLKTQGEYGGIRHVYRVGIGEIFKNLKKAQTVHFDLGIGDPVFPAPKRLLMESILNGVEDVSWSVYPVETIVAEKLHALIDFGEINSRSKDVYDLSLLLPKVNASDLIQAVEKSFTHRGTDIPKSFADNLTNLNPKRLRSGWSNAMSSIKSPPEFEDCFRLIIEELKKVYL